MSRLSISAVHLGPGCLAPHFQQFPQNRVALVRGLARIEREGGTLRIRKPLVLFVELRGQINFRF
jgi:hypothetical protein